MLCAKHNLCDMGRASAQLHVSTCFRRDGVRFLSAMKLPNIIERKRLKAPTVTPQALTWDGKQLWLSSRDLGTLSKIDVKTWKVAGEIDPPGIVWAGVSESMAET